MGRTLIVVPRMFTKRELEMTGLKIPADLNDKTKEFWDYVEERLNALSPRISKVYAESACKGGQDDVNMLKETSCRLHRVVSRLVAEGAEMTATEDQMLVLETESWSSLTRQNTVGAEKQMLEESLEDRREAVSNRVAETLREGEMGVLFISSLQIPDLHSDIRVIRMMPFDPKDYLETLLVSSRLQGRTETR